MVVVAGAAEATSRSVAETTTLLGSRAIWAMGSELGSKIEAVLVAMRASRAATLSRAPLSDGALETARVGFAMEMEEPTEAKGGREVAVDEAMEPVVGGSVTTGKEVASGGSGDGPSQAARPWEVVEALAETRARLGCWDKSPEPAAVDEVARVLAVLLSSRRRSVRSCWRTRVVRAVFCRRRSAICARYCSVSASAAWRRRSRSWKRASGTMGGPTGTTLTDSSDDEVEAGTGCVLRAAAAAWAAAWAAALAAEAAAAPRAVLREAAVALVGEGGVVLGGEAVEAEARFLTDWRRMSGSRSWRPRWKLGCIKRSTIGLPSVIFGLLPDNRRKRYRFSCRTKDEYCRGEGGGGGRVEGVRGWGEEGEEGEGLGKGKEKEEDLHCCAGSTWAGCRTRKCPGERESERG